MRRLQLSRVEAATAVVALALLASPVASWGQTAEERAAQYKLEAMEQALQTKQSYDLYGLHFESDQAAIQPQSAALLDDIAAAMNNFPDWNLRIVGHTDATADEAHNLQLSLDRAEAIKAALVERGVDAGRLTAGGVGETQPVAANDTPEGRALNRRVELVRYTDSAEAKRLLKAMSDYVAGQDMISFDYDSTLEVVTTAGQKLGLASSGTVTLDRPDHIHATRTGGFADLAMVFDGTTFSLLGNNAKAYTQIEIPGTIDNLVDELRDTYGRPLPAADLLMSNPYDELIGEVIDSKDLGSGVIGGKECDHLAFRTDDVDWQIWIAQGEQPYPCQYVITSKRMDHAPQYTIQIRDWRTGDEAATSDYAFEAPAGTTMIAVKDLGEKLSDLPGHFSVGGKQ